MKRILSLIVLAAITCPAHAEFAVISNEAEAPSQHVPAPAPHHSPSAHANPQRLKYQAPSAKHTARNKVSDKTEALATGFGAQVPLAFAIRQMAPEGYEVVLEPPADPDAVVDWRGGKAWTQSLADAVQPLGLAVTVQNKTVTIGLVHAINKSF